MTEWQPSSGWIVIDIALDPISHQPTNRGVVLAGGGGEDGPQLGDEIVFKEATIIDPIRRVMAVALVNVVAWRVVPVEPMIVAVRPRLAAVAANGDGG